MDSPRATVVVVFLLAALAAQSCSDNPAKGRPRPGEEPEISRASSTGFADLVRALLRHAGAAYSENNHEEAREFLRQARRRGTPGEIYRLNQNASVLILSNEEPSPFLTWCATVLFPELEDGHDGRLADPDDGFIVGDRALLKRIRTALFSPADGDQLVTVECRFLQMGAGNAREWLDRFPGTEPGGDWQYVPTRAEAEQLDAAIAEGAVRVLATPLVSTRSGQAVNVSVKTQRAYIDTYELVTTRGRSVAGPSVVTTDEGVRVDVLPTLDKENSPQLLLRSVQKTLRAMEQFPISIEPYASGVPVGVPIFHRHVIEADVPACPPDGVIIGFTPHDVEVEHGVEVSWLWVKCGVVENEAGEK